MGVIHCPPTTMMKVILFLAAICGAAYSDVSCDDCKVAAAGLIDRLTSEESIAEQIGIMIAAVCPSFPAELACEGCQGIMGRVAAYMEEQETIDAAVAFLSV